MAEQKTTADTHAEPHLPDRAEEARNLATEGVEEIAHGNKEEGKFLIDEARHLDKAAADEVVKRK
jgi:hypothetical protein